MTPINSVSTVLHMSGVAVARQQGRAARRLAAWRFGSVTLALPLVVEFLGVPCASWYVSRLVRGNESVAGPDWVYTAGIVATIGAIGFARTTRGRLIEGARYRSLPLAVAVASVGANSAIAGAGPAASGLVRWTAAPLGALLGGLVGRWVARRLLPIESMPVAGGPAPSGLLRVPLAAGATAVWSARLPRLSPLALVRFPVLFGLWALVFWSGSSGAQRAVVGGVLIAAALIWTIDWRARVTIGRGGLQVRGGVLHRVWQSVPLDAVVGARVVVAHRDLTWRSPQWSVPGQTALVPSDGEAMLARLTDGTQFVVRLADAATAVGVLNSLLDRRPPPGATSC